MEVRKKKTPPVVDDVDRLEIDRIGSLLLGGYLSNLTSPLPAAQLRVIKEPPFDAAKLEALKAAEPYRVTQRVPDMVEVITAWRAWRVTHAADGPRLQALGVSHVWEPRTPVEARCDKSGRSIGAMSGMYFPSGYSSQHRAPHWECECGVWAFKDLDGLTSALQEYSDVRVLGNVQLWGRVIETENGYRAEKAYPSELWCFSKDLEELGLIYDIPVRTIRG